MSSTPSDTTGDKQPREMNAHLGTVRGWYYLEYDWRTEGFIRGPFTVEDMRVLLKEGTIDDETPVRYFYSQWHPLRDVSTILVTPSRMTAPKRVHTGLYRIQKLAVLGVLAIILELILVHWTWPT